MGLSLVTAAASLPVTLAELKAELLSYAQSTANDAIITQKLYEATDYVQNETQRQFIQATWKQTWDTWPDDPCGMKGNGTGPLKIALQPLYSVSSVKYYDANGTQQTVSSSSYWVDVDSKPPRVKFKPTVFAWPPTEAWRPGAVEVTFIAGYANAAAVPYMAKLAIKELAAYWFEQREAAGVPEAAAPGGTSTAVGGEIPFGVTRILNMLKADGYT